MEDFIKDYKPKKSENSKYINVCDSLMEYTVDIKKKLDKAIAINGKDVTIKKLIDYCLCTAYAYNTIAIMYKEEGEENDRESTDS